jgi:peptidyl-prolyl cis-trans isomerase SurA
MKVVSVLVVAVCGFLTVVSAAGQVATPPTTTAPPTQAPVSQPAAAPAVVRMTPGKSTIIERVLVRVNGEVFTQTELERVQIEALRDQKRQVEDARALEDDASLKAMLSELTPTILVSAVEDLLLVQRGRELGITFTDAQYKSAVDSIKKDNDLDDKGLVEAMAQAGMTPQTLRQQLERTSIIRGVLQEEIHLNLTEEEARQYYVSHPDDFMKPATVTLREIFVAVPAQGKGAQAMISVGSANDAKAKIDAARARLLKGEDFAIVAGEVSESGSKANGGLIGQVELSNLNPALKDVLDKLKAGDVSEPLRTPTGYQMFKVDARTVPEREAFTKVRDLIGSRIFEDRLDAERKKLLTRLRSQALIEWKDQGYRQMYEKKVLEKAAEKAPEKADR